MLLALSELVTKFDMKINGVLHVGAHLAEEADVYFSLGVGPVWWIEGNPAVLNRIRDRIKAYPNQHVIGALVYSSDGVELDFNVTNYDGMSSSIFEFGTHPTFSPDTVFVNKLRLPTRSIDGLVKEHGITANFLNMDLQGAELHALQGGEDFLRGVDYVMTEVNREEVYVGCTKVHELDEFLSGFKRVETYWVPGQGWGDALYLRRNRRAE